MTLSWAGLIQWQGEGSNRSRDPAATPLLVLHADALAEVTSDDEFEIGLNALLTGFRDLAEKNIPAAGSRQRPYAAQNSHMRC
jgi:hypothetical protein